MEPVETGPRCSNQIHLSNGGGPPEPIPVCSCGAGLIHMLDCPVDMGLPCAFFRALEAAPAAVDRATAEDAHSRLMEDYLSRAYYHRVRALKPEGDAWHRRREELYAFYSTVELEGTELTDDEEGYERERERLLGLRQEREAERQQREEMTREEKARERQRLGIKTVVERAQEAVALQGGPAGAQPNKEVGGHGGEEPPEPHADGPEPQGQEPQGGSEQHGPPDGRPRRRRRRRRRRSGGPPGSASSPSQDSGA